MKRYAPQNIVDATITTLCRGEKRTLRYTLTYTDNGESVTVKGATRHMVSAFVPYGLDVDTMPDETQLVSIRCEYDLASKRITNVPMPALTLEPLPPRPYNELVRRAADALIAAMRSTSLSQRTVIADVKAAMRLATITSEVR